MKTDHSLWNYRTILIELLTLVAGFGSVVVYNRVFEDSISPMLGIVVGAINASLVGWCIHANRSHVDAESAHSVRDDYLS